MKTYGYVNTGRNETIDFIKEKVDEIIYTDNNEFDFSFAKKGDVIIFKDVPSVCTSLVGFLKMCKYVSDKGINVCFNSLDSRTLTYRLVIDVCASVYQLNKHFE